VLYCYGYREDSIETPPTFFKKLTFAQPIDTISIPKKDYPIVFTGTHYTVLHMYNPKGIFEFETVLTKQYRTHELDIVGIPE
jgi:hypothetical protein